MGKEEDMKVQLCAPCLNLGPVYRDGQSEGSYSKLEIILAQMVIGLSQNKIKTINSAEHPIDENNISRTTNENLGFFRCSQRVCRRTSAG